jgi:hypothetical protein
MTEKKAMILAMNLKIRPINAEISVTNMKNENEPVR